MVLIARRLACAAWWSRHGSPAPPRARPEQHGAADARGDWSYAQLHAAARFGAGELAARGAAPGARVAIALPAGLDFAQALHACLLLGAVAVPVDLRLAAAERARIADGAAVLVDEPLGEGPAPRCRACRVHATTSTRPRS